MKEEDVITLSKAEAEELGAFVMNLLGLCSVEESLNELMYDYSLDEKVLRKAIDKLGVK